MRALPFETYLVGGAVRDELLGQSVADRDWVVIGATPEAMKALGFEQIGNDFPCFLHPDTKEEYALARTERKSGSGHTGFSVDFHPEITLEEDLIRRDITINAIAKSADGELIDPFNGKADLDAGILRHVSPAFSEDPLRVLRVARFAARFKRRNFRVEKSTIELMQRLSTSGELDTLTPERVWKELFRALTEPTPSEFFRVLQECAALEVILPELHQLIGVPQPVEHHPETDTFDHVMLCVDYARESFDDPIVTFAALLHDLGKGTTPESEWPKHIGHEQRGLPLVQAVSARLKVPKEYEILAKLVCEHHLKSHTLHQLKASTALKLLEQLDAFRKPERIERFAKACEADARGRTGMASNPYPNRQLLADYYLAAKSVGVKPLVKAGYQGKKLGEQIRQHRIKAIDALKAKR